MRDADMGIGFYENGTEVGHLSGVLPVPRVGDVVNIDGKQLGRVRWIEYNYRHLSDVVILGVRVEMGPL